MLYIFQKRKDNFRVKGWEGNRKGLEPEVSLSSLRGGEEQPIFLLLPQSTSHLPY